MKQANSRAFRSGLEFIYDFRYTGCYGCGKCDGTRGYHYRYPDGREFYRCGSELIEIDDIRGVPVGELLALFKAQHGYYLAERA
jgi:hypothetical protein